MKAPRPVRSRRARSPRWKRALLALMCGLLLVLGVQAGTSASSKPRLFVFVSTSLKPLALQRTLQERLPQAEITVFGRFRDFRDGVANEAPDAVIAQRLVLENLGVAPEVQGKAAGVADEPYAIVAVGKSLSPADLAGKTVGTVDLLGRRKTRGFIGKLLGLAEAPKVTTVSKTEDLLALLQFQDADAIILPSRQVAFLQSKTQLELTISPLPSKVSLPAGAFLTAGGAVVRAALGSLTSREIGVDQWQ